MLLKRTFVTLMACLLTISCSKPTFSELPTTPVNTGNNVSSTPDTPPAPQTPQTPPIQPTPPPTEPTVPTQPTQPTEPPAPPTPPTPPVPPVEPPTPPPVVVDPPPVEPPPCKPGEISVPIPTKVLFVVDQSGSNATGPYEHPNMPTDKDKKFRSGVISNFFAMHGDKAHIKWGFVTFNKSVATALVHDKKNKPIFSDGVALEAALNKFEATKDEGLTPYKAALTMIHDMIKSDMAANPKGTQYRIAFLTDGYPTDYCPNNAAWSSACIGHIQNSKIMKDLSSVMSLGAAHAIEFSSVYYGFPDADASSRLLQMSKVGNGQFVDVNVNNNIDLDDIIKVPDNSHCVKQ